jgi:adenine-specific DNA-methyltransferase
MQRKQRLELTWIGKDDEPRLEPRILIEDPDRSYGAKDMQNMLIHGDNLLALKALEQDFAGKVKCIYIDPPFNTGAAFEHYDDSLEHSIWLQLMHHRVMSFYNLLSSDGCIFIQLDDSEASYCKILMDEIFGRNNYINQITVSTNKPFGYKSTSTALFKQSNQILFYAKDKSKFILNTDELFIERQYDTQYKWVFENMNKPEDQWTWRNISEVVSEELGFSSRRDAKKSLSKQEFEAETAIFALNNAKAVFRTASVTGGAYLKRKETINLSKRNKKEIIRHPNDDMDYMFIGGERVIFYHERLVEIQGQMVPGELITDMWTDISVEGLAAEGGIAFPKGKKPERLIQRCLTISTKAGDLIFDSFLGSGTTAAVAHKMGRNWIGIELGDHCYTHCLPRLQKVCDGTDQGGISKSVDWKGGGGFKFYELAPSLLKKDKYDNWVISKQYNADMLASAMAKHEGFKYSPNDKLYWKQGQSTEKDFIFTTTQMVTVALIDRIIEEMKTDESLLICCKSYQKVCENKYPNISIKKIPNMLLGRCEFGKEDYSFSIVDMPRDEDEQDFVPVGPEIDKNRKKKKDSEPTLF